MSKRERPKGSITLLEKTTASVLLKLFYKINCKQHTIHDFRGPELHNDVNTFFFLIIFYIFAQVLFDVICSRNVLQNKTATRIARERGVLIKMFSAWNCLLHE